MTTGIQCIITLHNHVIFSRTNCTSHFTVTRNDYVAITDGKKQRVCVKMHNLSQHIKIYHEISKFITTYHNLPQNIIIYHRIS